MMSLPAPRVVEIAAQTADSPTVSARASSAVAGTVFSALPVQNGTVGAREPEKTATSRRVEVTRPVAGREALSAVTSLSPMDAAGASGWVLTRDAALPPEVVAPRGPAARGPAAQLASRGGLMPNKKSVELRPEAKAEVAAVSESQRVMLARLDADLGRAQKRLNRAESRLSEGQRQLGMFTGVLQSAMLEAGDDARGLHPFVRVAQRYLGTPYVWGGESARGFDCSGFIMRVMRDLGYRALPHSAAEQFRYGMPIAKPLLKAGDVVFFANTYKPGVSHVGIYLGRGRFIHAANSKVGTIVSSLGEPKWTEKYAGARRLLPVKS